MLDMPSVTDIDRRGALRLLAAGMSAAMARCAPPNELTNPYVSGPLTTDPGALSRYATTLLLAGYGRGALALVRDGRPIKLEGNPHHPASLGATDMFAEAAILDLYDPQRLQTPMGPQGPTSWAAFAETMRARLIEEEKSGGRGLRLLTGRITSPTALRQIARAQTRFPLMRWARFEPIHDDNAVAGARLAWGQPAQMIAHLDRARVIVSLDADFLGPGPDQIRLARGFAARRTSDAQCSRLYTAHTALSATSACADHRIALRPRDVGYLTYALANALTGASQAPPLAAQGAAFAQAAAEDMRQAPGAALVLAGASLPPDIHALCAWINARIAAPIEWIAPIDPHPESHAESLLALSEDLHEGKASTLLIIGANPLYAAPAFRLADGLRKTPFTAYFGAYDDETANACQWRAPLSHPLETWADARSASGEASIAQPVIRPLYDTRSTHAALALLTNELGSEQDLVAVTWRERWGAAFDERWRKALAKGIIEDERPAALALRTPRTPAPFAPASPGPAWALVLTPSASVWDGDRAPNAWLQECPDPLTKETWGASVRMSAADAGALDLSPGDIIRVERGGAAIEAPIFIERNQTPGVLALPLGYGRWKSGPIADGVGANAYRLRGKDMGFVIEDVTVRKTGAHAPTPTTQHLFAMAGGADALFPIARPGMTAAPREAREKPTLSAPLAQVQPAWAMVIDNAACIGCNTASSPARPRTISRSSAPKKSPASVTCIGCAWIGSIAPMA
jgi:molybdopterin-containing oxidoreductase family iron-sulfur binding subunit